MTLTGSTTSGRAPPASGSELRIHDLEADTEYEARVQGKKGSFLGGYSPILVFRTPKPKLVVCTNPNAVQPPSPATGLGKPMLSVEPNRLVDAYGHDMRLLEVENLGGGYFRGTGKVFVNLLRGMGFLARFERIFIDENGVVGDGKIILVSRGIKAMEAKQLGKQKERRKAKQSSEKEQAFIDQLRKETAFTGDIQLLEGTITAVTTNADSSLTVSKADGSQQKVAAPTKPTLIADQEGNVYLADGKGNVAKQPARQNTAATGNGNASTDKSLPMLDSLLQTLRQQNQARLDSLTQARSALQQAQSQARNRLLAQQPALQLAGNGGQGGGAGSADVVGIQITETKLDPTFERLNRPADVKAYNQTDDQLRQLDAQRAFYQLIDQYLQAYQQPAALTQLSQRLQAALSQLPPDTQARYRAQPAALRTFLDTHIRQLLDAQADKDFFQR